MSTDLDRYISQADAPARMIDGLSASDLVAPPPRDGAAGQWTIQQVVVHLWHSDLAATHRMLRIACEDRPLLIAYDETAHAAALGYNALDVGLVCEVFRLNRLHTADVLGRLPENAFARVGIHNQRGAVTLGEMVKIYADHVDHHAAFVAKKRAALAKT